jgi:hypothetical protein
MGKTRILTASFLLVSAAATTIWLSLPTRHSDRPARSNTAPTERKRPPGSTEAKLINIRLPAFKVEDISVAEFVDYLRERSITCDENPGDFPGVDFRFFNAHSESPAPDAVAEATAGTSAGPIAQELRIRELSLESMSLGEVLKHAFGAGQIRYAIRDEAVWFHGPGDL